MGLLQVFIRRLRTVMREVREESQILSPTITTDAPPPALPLALRQRLRAALLRVPIISTFAGRTSLLNGLPSTQALSRIENNAQLDLDGIINQLDTLGPLSNRLAPLSTDRWPLLLLIENARSHVAGFALEDELIAVGNEIRQIYSGR